MGIFTQKECKECSIYQDKVDILNARNKRLEEVLRELKKQYDALQAQDNDEEPAATGISSAEVDTLFQTIKNSTFDKDKKRYFRSMLMLIKDNYTPSIHQYLQTELKTQ